MKRKVTEAQKKATAKYNEQNYDQLKIHVPKGMKEQIKKTAESHGQSMTAFILSCLKNKLEEF